MGNALSSLIHYYNKKGVTRGFSFGNMSSDLYAATLFYSPLGTMEIWRLDGMLLTYFFWGLVCPLMWLKPLTSIGQKLMLLLLSLGAKWILFFSPTLVSLLAGIAMLRKCEVLLRSSSDLKLINGEESPSLMVADWPLLSQSWIASLAISSLLCKPPVSIINRLEKTIRDFVWNKGTDNQSHT